jgi:hypothetical protein
MSFHHKAHIGRHNSTQLNRMREQREKMWRAGKMVRLRGCYTPQNYDDEVLKKVSYENWEVACDQAPYPLLCINCLAIIRSPLCHANRLSFRGGVGAERRRVIGDFIVHIKALVTADNIIQYEVAYQDTDEAEKTHGTETFDRWAIQHHPGAARSRDFEHHKRR